MMGTVMMGRIGGMEMMWMMWSLGKVVVNIMGTMEMIFIIGAMGSMSGLVV